MGTKMAPAYANIFMGRLEGQLLKSVALRPFSWLRFIDDIDMKLSHGREALTAFLDEANNFHSSINRRPKSLRDLLVRAKLKPDMRDDEPLGETRPCGKARCKTCKMITPTQIAKSASGAIIKLRCNTSCKTTNIVYLITCTKCGKQYVGETGDHVNQRMNGHRDDWKHKRFERSPVAEHFCSPEHDFLNHATLCCLDHNPEWTDRTRKARESYWIRRLNTLRPYGINKGDQ